jgi:hypothetical protein
VEPSRKAAIASTGTMGPIGFASGSTESAARNTANLNARY